MQLATDRPALYPAGHGGRRGRGFPPAFRGALRSCHGHSGNFARDALETVDGVVRGRKSGQDIKAFLPGHFGRLSPKQVELFVEVFSKQIESGGLFEQRCAICHVRARDLVRANMIVVEGRLVGRYSGRDIETFLRGHGRASETEAGQLYQVLLSIAEGGR